jgi:hypothetical protein
MATLDFTQLRCPQFVEGDTRCGSPFERCGQDKHRASPDDPVPYVRLDCAEYHHILHGPIDSLWPVSHLARVVSDLSAVDLIQIEELFTLFDATLASDPDANALYEEALAMFSLTHPLLKRPESLWRAFIEQRLTDAAPDQESAA